MEGGERETGEPESEPHRLLRLSEELLRQRDFSGCRNYALQAQHSDPHLARADQILAIADVLLAAQTRIHHHHPNYYSILQLDPLCQDPEIIKNHLKRLIILLNPINNGFSFAEEAFTVLCEAWSVLSEPAIKADYDGEVAKYYRRAEEVSSEDCEGGKKGGDDGDGSFWTACPYCYYLYEYERVYVDCCLRCQNCRRAFHGAIIQSPAAAGAWDGAVLLLFGGFSR
ncbi:hypothetical protein L1049_024570 [Liquidambar formosana]|uniref:J domain-containing protein n=1 Tax=Liquidambar formosana TaxID=63359 RepID=A0AAP0S1S1_LIQFO